VKFTSAIVKSIGAPPTTARLQMSTTDELLSDATAYAETFAKGELPLPPGRKVATVACVDARLNARGCSADPKV
jgi:hypothetical protein